MTISTLSGTPGAAAVLRATPEVTGDEPVFDVIEREITLS